MYRGAVRVSLPTAKGKEVILADLPAGDYVLRVGQYTWPEVKPVLVIDAMGNPQSDAVGIPVRVTK